MAATYALPFQRGTTWKDGFTSTTAGAANSPRGRVFLASDQDRPPNKRHNKSVDPEELILLRNRSGATIKRGASGREDSRLWKLRMSSAAAHGDITTVGAFGNMAYGLDDAMDTSKGVAVGDDALFIRKGLTRLTLITAVSAMAPGDRIMCRTGGYIGPYTIAGTFKNVIGISLETVTESTAGKRTILCLVGEEWAAGYGHD